MVDQVENASVAAVPVAPASPVEPVAPANVASPVVPTTPAPSSEPSSVPAADAATSQTQEIPVPAPGTVPGQLDTKPKDTLLGTKEAPADVKKPEAEVRPVEGDAAATETAPALPVYEPFTLPEGIALDQLDQTALSDFTQKLGQFEISSKADHAEVQKFANDMMAVHVAALQDTVQRVNEAWQAQLDRRQEAWKDSFEKHPVYGGNRRDTTFNGANEFIKTHVGNAEQQTAFREMLNETGAGDHPEMIGLLARLNSAYREGRPVPAMKPQPEKLKPYQKAYGGNK